MDQSNIISKTDTEGIITYVNDSFCKISGYNREEVIGKKHNITRHHENPNELYEEMWHTLKVKEESWEGVLKNQSKSGSTYYVRTIITPIKNIKNEIVEYFVVRDNLNTVVDDKKFLFEKIEENELSILVVLQIDEFDMLDKFYNASTVEKLKRILLFNFFLIYPKNIVL